MNKRKLRGSYFRGVVKNNSGAVLPEYALGVLFLVIVFVAAGVYLTNAVYTRIDAVAESHETMVPCGHGGDLTPAECL
ncbi:MAG: hypothetical protein D6719_03175 [Candidatus Dadabacteria bacterium]|nr:MAG: hypothetical protein D6719_03175 [Candidatus Dadabacteria bacterium]